MARPIIGITMSDAAGVRPEIIMKAMAVPEVYEMSRPLVIGDARRLRKAGQIVGSKLSVRPIQRPEEAAFRPGEVEVVDLPIIPEDLPFGKLSATAGDAAFKFIQRAVELAMAGRIDAICTAPLNKEALHAGGHKYPGHTELLAKLSGTEEVSMMLATPKMRVIIDTSSVPESFASSSVWPGYLWPPACRASLFSGAVQMASMRPAMASSTARWMNLNAASPAVADSFPNGRSSGMIGRSTTSTSPGRNDASSGFWMGRTDSLEATICPAFRSLRASPMTSGRDIS